jgi:geranylgeranyl pyrophosphate synthase
MIKEVVLLDLVQPDLTRVEEKMRSISAGAYAPLADAFLQLLASGGKRLRPALALGAYGFFNDRMSDKVIAMAAAVETLHTATLVHDDLIDNALVRRGATTLNASWNKGATVLAGDYLFARAAGFAAETEHIRVVQLFADTLRIIVEGELRQLFSSGQWRQPKEAYYPRIFAKTASLFAAATRSGAILGGATREQEEALYTYGNDLGMAFQIVDDILDYAGNEATLGKPVGGDLRQGIITLPFFYFLQAHPDPEQVLRKLEEGSGNGSAGRAEAMNEVIAAVRASDAMQRATEEALDFVRRAKASLALFPASPYRQALAELTDFVVSRRV